MRAILASPNPHYPHLKFYFSRFYFSFSLHACGGVNSFYFYGCFLFSSLFFSCLSYLLFGSPGGCRTQALILQIWICLRQVSLFFKFWFCFRFHFILVYWLISTCPWVISMCLVDCGLHFARFQPPFIFVG